MLNLFLKLCNPLAAFLISTLTAFGWNYIGAPGIAKSATGLASASSAMGVFAQISATMLGFMMAVLAILASISGTRLVRSMQQSGHFHKMLVTIFIDSAGFAATTICALIATFRPDKILVISPIVFGATVFSAMLFAASMTMLWITLTNLNPNRTEPE